MRTPAPARIAACSLACVLVVACGSSAPAAHSRGAAEASTASPGEIPAARPAASQPLLDWPEFGLDPERSNASERATGITSANVARLRRITVHVPGIVDSSPIYLHGVLVAGATRNVAVATTIYGKTVAIDVATGHILWTFTPPGYERWARSSQITTASPIADPGRAFVYAASPNGLIHKLSLTSGSEASGGSWPVSVTRDPAREKIAAALNVAGADVLATTGGYYGDAPPYQGHVVRIERASGRVRAVFNSLCADRARIIVPSSCSASGSAAWARAGAVVEPGARRILIATGNGPFNERTNFGDSVLELTLPDLHLRQSFTPQNQAQLNSTDTDLGSSAPALLGNGRVVIAGKDGVMRVLGLASLDGHPASSPAARSHPVGGEVQRLSTPHGDQLFTTPAVWRHGAHTTVFVADNSGTAAYVSRAGNLFRAWINGNPGTSPVMAGGLLYVYDPSGGGINVYNPGSARPIAKLAGSAGHWNSPIVADGHVLESEGNGFDHSESGQLEIFSP
jgi:putative pyrroloquinoline-quinone binding quinoprotein